MPAPLKWRRKVALAKLETTYAVDSTPTGAANAMLLTNIEVRPMEGEDTTREIEWPHLGAQPQIPTGLRATLTGSVELVGSGRAAAIGRVNARAGALRGRFVTIAPGQEMIYLAKEAEAARYLSAPTEDLVGFPFLAAEVGITAPTAFALAELWSSLAVQYRVIGAGIEQARLGAVATIEAATAEPSIGAAEAAFAAAAAAIEETAP